MQTSCNVKNSGNAVKTGCLQNFCDGEPKIYFEMKEGYKFSCVKMFWYITKWLVLLEILHTSSTVKTSKNMVKSDISESICVGEPNFFWNEEEV